MSNHNSKYISSLSSPEPKSTSSKSSVSGPSSTSTSSPSTGRIHSKRLKIPGADHSVYHVGVFTANPNDEVQKSKPRTSYEHPTLLQLQKAGYVNRLVFNNKPSSSEKRHSSTSSSSSSRSRNSSPASSRSSSVSSSKSRTSSVSSYSSRTSSVSSISSVSSTKQPFYPTPSSSRSSTSSASSLSLQCQPNPNSSSRRPSIVTSSLSRHHNPSITRSSLSSCSSTSSAAAAKSRQNSFLVSPNSAAFPPMLSPVQTTPSSTASSLASSPILSPQAYSSMTGSMPTSRRESVRHHHHPHQQQQQQQPPAIIPTQSPVIQQIPLNPQESALAGLNSVMLTPVPSSPVSPGLQQYVQVSNSSDSSPTSIASPEFVPPTQYYFQRYTDPTTGVTTTTAHQAPPSSTQPFINTQQSQHQQHQYPQIFPLSENIAPVSLQQQQPMPPDIYTDPTSGTTIDLSSLDPVSAVNAAANGIPMAIPMDTSAGANIQYCPPQFYNYATFPPTTSTIDAVSGPHGIPLTTTATSASLPSSSALSSHYIPNNTTMPMMDPVSAIGNVCQPIQPTHHRRSSHR